MADCPICAPVCFSLDCQLALGSWPFVSNRSGAGSKVADCPICASVSTASWPWAAGPSCFQGREQQSGG